MYGQSFRKGRGYNQCNGSINNIFVQPSRDNSNKTQYIGDPLSSDFSLNTKIFYGISFKIYILDMYQGSMPH